MTEKTLVSLVQRGPETLVIAYAHAHFSGVTPHGSPIKVSGADNNCLCRALVASLLHAYPGVCDTDPEEFAFFLRAWLAENHNVEFGIMLDTTHLARLVSYLETLKGSPFEDITLLFLDSMVPYTRKEWQEGNLLQEQLFKEHASRRQQEEDDRRLAFELAKIL